MSEKKKLKQSRLPFQILGQDSPQTPKITNECKDSDSPKHTGDLSRKRKPSTDAEILKSPKITRVTASKENFVDVIELVDDSDDNSIQDTADVENSNSEQSNNESSIETKEPIVHIKLPHCSKLKNNTETKILPPKPSKANDTEEEEDSIIYLDESEVAEICKKAKKSATKVKKKSDKTKNVMISRRSLKMNESLEDKAPIENNKDEQVNEDPKKSTTNDPSPDIDKESELETELESDTSKSDKSSQDSDISNKSSTDAVVLSDDLTAVPSTPISIKTDEQMKQLTPKQLEWRKKLEEKRLEKEKIRQQEREAKEELRKKEKEERDEQKRKQREEKDEQRRVEREEREKKRQLEVDQKNEEKRQKEIERRKKDEAKEEERKKKEEQLNKKEQEKEEAEQKKKRASEAFLKFFPKRKKTSEDENGSIEIEDESEIVTKKQLAFMPFQIKESMKLAPTVRVNFTKDQVRHLDNIWKMEQNLSAKQLYINELKTGIQQARTSEKTWLQTDNDLMMIDELDDAGEDIPDDSSKIKMKCRAKFLYFKENRRPAYYGTWRKKSTAITARKPFGKDNKVFDYEVDSDDEWEEEEPGESLHGSDDEKDKDSEGDDYEVDNDFFVPHGHLSDEELRQDDEEEPIEEDNSPETQKAKLKILQQEFAAEMKKKTEKIKPRLIGCIWMQGNEDENGCHQKENEKQFHCSDIIWRILKAREMMTNEEEINLMENLEPDILPLPLSEDPVPNKIPQTPKVSRVIEDPLSIRELIKLIHGNLNSKRFLLREYQAFRLKNYHGSADYQDYSSNSVITKINELASYTLCPEEGAMFSKKCWYVKPETIQHYFHDIKDIPTLPNNWQYILEKKVKERDTSFIQKKALDAAENVKVQEISNEIKNDPVHENVEVMDKSNIPSKGPIVKKRVQLLMSVPRGQQISETKKNNLISQYLKSHSSSGNPVTTPGPVPEIIDLE